VRTISAWLGREKKKGGGNPVIKIKICSTGPRRMVLSVTDHLFFHSCGDTGKIARKKKKDFAHGGATYNHETSQGNMR